MANNLFIVGTPYHLLTAFIISKTFCKKDDNYLALVHPHGYKEWIKDDVMRFLSSTEAGYLKVFPLITWMTSKEKKISRLEQVEYVRQSIKPLNIENVFLSCDDDLQNQLLVSAIGINKFYRFEDGMYSYYNKDRKRPYLHRIFHRLKIKLLQMITHIDSNMYINTSVRDDSKAGIADFLYMPDLINRYSPKVIEIRNKDINVAIKILRDKGLLKQTLFDNDYSIYLSQPITEQGKLTFEEEIRCIENCLNRLDSNTKLIYKAHPNDKKYKLEYVREHFSNVIVLDSKIPVELFLYKEPKIKEVISYQSTTLIIAKKFTSRNIKCISLINNYHKKLDSGYVEIMKKAGVVFL